MHNIALLAAVVAIAITVVLFVMRHTLTKLEFTIGMVAVATCIGMGAIAQHKAEYEEDAQHVWWEGGIKWGHTPVTVAWNHAYYSDYNDTIRASIQLWNTALGCEALKEVPQDDGMADANIKPFDGETCAGQLTDMRSADGNTVLASTTACTPHHEDVVTYEISEVNQARYVFEHEFGHVLDMWHTATGIMSSIVMEVSTENPPDIKLLSQAQIDAARQWYCNRK